MNENYIPKELYKKIISSIPICCVDLVIKKKDSFLLVKRKENPAKNQWWFPGGRVLFSESLKDAVRRKLREELNIKNYKKIKFLGVKELRFKKGKFQKPVYAIVNIFLAEVKKKKNDIKLDKTTIEYKWFNRIQKSSHPYIKKFLKLAGF